MNGQYRSWEQAFYREMKSLLGFKVKGRGIIEGVEGYQLREESVADIRLFSGPKKTI